MVYPIISFTVGESEAGVVWGRNITLLNPLVTFLPSQISNFYFLDLSFFPTSELYPLVSPRRETSAYRPTRYRYRHLDDPVDFLIIALSLSYPFGR